MSKLVQRIVALVVMLAVVMSATAYGASTFVVDYQELKSDAPVVMTVNGEEIHADEYASYMMSQIINYQQMYAMYGLSEKNMASTFGDAAKESAKQQVALIHIVKQKMAENNGGYKAVNFGYTDDRVYSKLTSDNPIDLVRYQLANCYMGRAGLINSGGAAGGETDLADAVRTAVINKRAGGMGLILGRKAFKKSMADGVKLINAVQDVYLDGKVTIA